MAELGCGTFLTEEFLHTDIFIQGKVLASSSEHNGV
jgi:hypothetical protein